MAVALIATGPFVLHLREALPGGRLAVAGQRAFWLPWQLYANVVSGRGFDDSSGFLGAADAGLFQLVGNPATALFLAPLHALGAPVLAHNLGLLLLVVTNAMGAWAFGETLRPRPRGLLAAAMVGGAGWWMAQLGQGALAAAWVGPGLAAAAALRRDRVAWFFPAFVVGLVGAPVVTAAALLACRLAPSPSAYRQPPYALGGAGLALLIALVAPAATSAGAAAHLPPTLVVWLASGATPGLPVAFLLGLGALWASRSGRGRLAVAAAIGAVILGIGPVVRDAAGAPVRVAGFGLPIGPDLPILTTHGPELVSAALLVGLIGALTWAARARLGRFAELAVGIALLVEPRLQAAAGQPIALWAGHTWPIPRAFDGMARAPYTTSMIQLPLLDVSDGLVGFVPFHRQRVSGGPGLQEDGPARLGTRRAATQDPALQSALRLGDGAANLDIGVLLKQSGYDWLLVAGADPSLRVAAARALGKPTYEDGAFAIWSTGLGPTPGATPGRPGAEIGGLIAPDGASLPASPGGASGPGVMGPGSVGVPVGGMGAPPGAAPGTPPTFGGAPPEGTAPPPAAVPPEAAGANP